MLNQFSRTQLLIGEAAVQRLQAAKVAIFGVGGVGGYTAEALARSGVGKLDLFDNDTICPTNLNRQLHALHSTVGRFKVEVAKERILDINPAAVVNSHRLFYLPETASQVDLTQYDYIVDAIDTVAGKIELAVRSHEFGIMHISSMGAGNKLNADLFAVSDVYETSVCPLAKVMRHELRKRGVKRTKVVWSPEPPLTPAAAPPEEQQKYSQRRQIPGSTAFVPAVAGLIIAGEVVKDLTKAVRSGSAAPTA
jgi:tRNA A37 threonylcarbamoyladenosine dehydratase